MSPAPKNEHVAVRVIAGVIIVLLIAGVAYWLMKDQAEAPLDDISNIEVKTIDVDNTIPVTQTEEQPTTMEKPETNAPDVTVPASVNINKSFNIISTNFSFSEKEIRVSKGDKVKISLLNNEGYHDLRIDEFKVKSIQIGEGDSTTVEFTADKVGMFEYYCSVGNHRAMGMAGKLIVE